MAFSSQLFLYGFMPIFFALYYLVPYRYKNALILVGSLLFYSVGAGSAVLVLIASIFVNHYVALRIAQAPDPRRRMLLVIGIAVNVLSLAYYKYTGFLWLSMTPRSRRVCLRCRTPRRSRCRSGFPSS